jgi:hypothetical protein
VIIMNRWFLSFCLVASAGSAAAQTAGYVAGLHPDRRPDGAPRLEQVTLTPEQLQRALHGIEGPAPGNVESIAATGKWWVPLRGPGMNPPYDLRGWHGDSASASVAASPVAPSSR